MEPETIVEEHQRKLRDNTAAELHWIINNHNNEALVRQLAEAELRRRDKEEIEKKAAGRHKEIEAHLVDLKSHHRKELMVSILILVVAVIAAYFAWLAIPSSERPIHPTASGSQQSEKMIPQPTLLK